MTPASPPRRAAPSDPGPAGQTRASRDSAREPSLPHESDESSHSQESATAAHGPVGRRAFDNATDGTQDTDRGPLMDQVYNEKVAPDRGPGKPRA